MILKNMFISKYLLALVLVISPIVSFAVDTPGDARGTEVGQNQVKWEWEGVADADLYEVTLDGTFTDVTKETHYFAYNQWQGEHSFTVRAKTNDGSYSSPTPTIKINVNGWFTPKVLNRSFAVGPNGRPLLDAYTPSPILNTVQTPTGLVGTLLDSGDIRWQWNAVENAVSYDVTVSGIYSGSPTNTQFISYGLPEGTYSTTVLAVDSDGQTSANSSVVTITIDPPPSTDSRQEVDVYLLSGQSNAAADTFYYLKNRLANRYESYPEDFGTAHWNMGGASIAQWIDTESNKGQNWLDMMQQLDIAVQAQLIAGKKLRSINLLWIQGERDAKDRTNYHDMFLAFVESWNTEIANKYDVPAYLATGLPWVQECHSLWKSYYEAGLPSVRQAQIDVAAMFSNVSTWETSDIYREDCIHIADFRLSTHRAIETAVELRESVQ